MITADFTFCEWEDVGLWGLRMKGHPEFDPSTEYGVAHDILEHFPSGGTGVAGELMALGAMRWVRWETGVQHTINPYRRDFACLISGDWSTIWRQSTENELFRHDLPGCPHVKRIAERGASRTHDPP